MGLDVESLDAERDEGRVQGRGRGGGARHACCCGRSPIARASRSPTATCRSAWPSWPPPARPAPRSCEPSWSRTTSCNALKAQIREEKTLDMLVSQAKITDADPDRLIVTPQEARKVGGRLILSPEEARKPRLSQSESAADPEPKDNQMKDLAIPARAATTSSSRRSSSRPTGASAAGTSSPACSRTGSSSWARRSTTTSPTSSSPSCCSSRARTRTRTSCCTSTRRAGW